MELTDKKDSDSKIVKKRLYVKYMVCERCKWTVTSELNKMGFTYRISFHQAVEFLEEISHEQFKELKSNLLKSGLVLLDEHDSNMIHRIIITIMDVIHNSEKLPDMSFSDVITERIGYGDDSVAKIFSDVKGMSVLQFIVLQKIERLKELLLYKNLTLSEIAEKLKYKNEHFLVAQLKKFTGLSPSYYQKIKEHRLKSA